MVHPRILPRATQGHGIAASSAAPRAAEGMAVARRGARISTRSWRWAPTPTIARTIRRRSTRVSQGQSLSLPRKAPRNHLLHVQGSLDHLSPTPRREPARQNDLLEWMQETVFALCRQGGATPTAMWRTARRGGTLRNRPRSPANLVDLNLESTTCSQSLDSQAQISADHWRWVLRLHPRASAALARDERHGGCGPRGPSQSESQPSAARAYSERRDRNRNSRVIERAAAPLAGVVAAPAVSGPRRS